jgi:hypothetical protein
MRVLDESYNENGLVVRVRVAPDTLARFKQRFSL